MKRNKNKIIRAATVAVSIDQFDEVLRKVNDAGYDMVAVTVPG